MLSNVILVLFFLYVKRAEEIKKKIQEQQRDLLRQLLEKQTETEGDYSFFNHDMAPKRISFGKDPNKNREQLTAFTKELLEKQILLMRQSDCDLLIPIEISRYLKDFLLDQVVKGEISPVAKRRVHGKVVKMYPELFQIFD